MSRYVVDASVACKWVIEEPGTAEALGLRRAQLVAPYLLIGECANVLWKKVRAGELRAAEARFAARLLARSGVEYWAEDSLLEPALGIAVELNHPAYDCVYLALAVALDMAMITADEGFIRKAAQRRAYHGRVLSLGAAAARFDR